MFEHYVNNSVHCEKENRWKDINQNIVIALALSIGLDTSVFSKFFITRLLIFNGRKSSMLF